MDNNFVYNTMTTDRCRISETEFKTLLLHELGNEYNIEFADRIKKLRDQISDMINKKIVRIKNKNLWVDFANYIVYPDFEREPIDMVDKIEEFDAEAYVLEHELIIGLDSQLPTFTLLRKMKWQLPGNLCCVSICDDSRYLNYGEMVYYNIDSDRINSDDIEVMGYHFKKCVFTVTRLSASEIYCTEAALFNLFIAFELIPIGLSPETEETLLDLIVMVKAGYMSYQSGKTYSRWETLLRDMVNDINGTLINSLRFKFIDIIKEVYQEKSIRGESMEEIKEKLLSCEKKRADIEPYEEKILTDPNRGHWDLWWGEYTGNEYTVLLEDSLYARNPECDIREEGVIAIDFGTKSTIVVYQSDIEHSLPMGIGDGNLSEGPTPMRFENPTVMHFVDLDSFMKSYKEKAGRPDTSWDDLTISHTAQGQFETSKSEEYYEYMHQIKQWAGQREKQFRIKAHSGESILLKPFLELGEDDINPIELYAYYIGLYINNMRHGIYLDYYLSFPVTYEVKIREKIVKSFESGLKKSLPETILKNDKIMSRFRVNGEISEPAAYAVCALQEYGFDPVGDEEIFYGIFDFGGGTTDFDFGLWKESGKRRYDYTIENFGAGGDEFLGGENLLEMLAFEIFKKNQDMMREKGYTFTLAPKCTEFIGSDALLSDSQEAEKNMFNLISALRPFWEESDQYLASQIASITDYIEYIRQIIVEKGLDDVLTDFEAEVCELQEDWSTQTYEELKAGLDEIALRHGLLSSMQLQDEAVLKVDLFDKDGIDHANESIAISKKEIATFIEDKIRDGVKNFFAALLLSYQNDKVKKPSTVNILLAGNSCKSPIVKRVFEEEIRKQQENIKKIYDTGIDGEKLFEIFPPLGTPEAYQKMKERGIQCDEYDAEKPTGKTGVAFGLIQCREGGVIERITNMDSTSEIPFQFYIGWQAKKKFKIFKDSNKTTKYLGKPDYGEWYQFIEADASTFYLYYTSLPECVNGDLLIDGNAAVKRLKCVIDRVDDNAHVYFRAVSPHTIEYTVSYSSDVESDGSGEIFTKELG